MDRKTSFVAALWWVLSAFLLGLCLLLFANKDGGISERENRMLAAFPKAGISEILSGDFMRGLETWCSDGFFAREKVIDCTDGMLSVFSRTTQDDEYLLDDTEERIALLDADVAEGEEDAPEEMEEDGEAPAEPEEEIETAADAPPENRFVLVKNSGRFKHVYSYYEKNRIRLAETLSMIRAVLPEDGSVHYAQVPVTGVAKRWLLQPEIYRGWASTGEETIQALCTQGVVVHNAPALLAPYMIEEKCYLYTDHHWSARGAYHLCMEIMKSQGYPEMPFDEYEYRVNKTGKTFRGEADDLEILSPLQPVKSLVVTNRTQEKEISLMNRKSTTYVAFMNNSRRPWRRVITGYHTGRKALVIGDSFANAFAPYLLPYYDEVHMCDVRHNYYKKAQAGGNVAELVAYWGVDDIYIIMATANGINSKSSQKYLREYFFE
ncbi:MAG: hypothetical protein ACOYI8_01115 [Christensenellales bacterium]|jgi:hypothetical protein